MASDRHSQLADPDSPSAQRKDLSHDWHILLPILLGGLPSTALAALLLALGGHSAAFNWTLGLLLALGWIAGGALLRRRIVRPLQTLSNMVSALLEEDYSFRVRGGNRRDALSSLIYELNALADRLQVQNISALEATALLKKVLMEIDVAVFTFDRRERLRIVNRAGEQLLGRIAPRLLGLTGEELGLSGLLHASPQTVEMTFPGKHGRWAVSHTAFRENGVPHKLLIISDMSRALREEERQAWKRLIRVLGHELNNSLAPIKSIAGTLTALAGRATLPGDIRQDMRQGLQIIESRADSLNRFMQAYTRLARMPAPSKSRIEVGDLVRRAASLELRLPVLVEGPGAAIEADPDQMEQLLINLIRNAVDASLDPALPRPGPVRVGWRVNAQNLELFVLDEGQGLLNSENLFVPFFTTKHGGSGIGLILSRQIAEAHGGSLQLANRKDRAGCEATLELPLSPGHPRDRSQPPDAI